MRPGDDYTPGWGEPYGGAAYETRRGVEVRLYRKGQRCRWIAKDGRQVGPEQSNVAPALAYAMVNGWRDITHLAMKGREAKWEIEHT